MVRHLHEHLGDRLRVAVLDTAITPRFGPLLPSARYVRGDVASPAHVASLLRGAAGVVHCAGLVGDATTPLAAYERVNVTGTRVVAEACLELEVGALVYTSSGAYRGEGGVSGGPDSTGRPARLLPCACGPLLTSRGSSPCAAASVLFSRAAARPEGGGGSPTPVPETAPARPPDDCNGPYAASKAAAERLVLAAHSHVTRVRRHVTWGRGAAAGLRRAPRARAAPSVPLTDAVPSPQTIVLRPGAIYGLGDPVG